MFHILSKENFQAIHQELELVKSSGQLLDFPRVGFWKKIKGTILRLRIPQLQKLNKLSVVLHIVISGKLNFLHTGQGSVTLRLHFQKVTLRKNGQFNFVGHCNSVAWNVLKIL